MDLERLLVEGSTIELRVDEYHQPDGAFVDSYPGPHVVAIAFGGTLAALTPEGRAVRELSREASRALFEAALVLRNGDVHPGPDTAVGRTVTTLTLRLDHARGAEHSFTSRAVVNHTEPRALPPSWSSVLRQMQDAIGMSYGAAADAWEMALTWTTPVDLGPAWSAGGPVRAPHVVTTVEHDGDLYVRSGQPPGPSRLYRFTRLQLEDLDSHRPVRPVEDHLRRWRLPCGGGVVALYREWERPTRYVFRTDDVRGLYVQKA